MKKLVFIVAGVLVLTLLIAVGCTSISEPAPGEEVSTCVKCHTDKDLLKQTAYVVEEEKSEATSGEG
jgi:hypothetical protein